MRSDCSVSLERKVPSGLPQISPEKLLKSNPSGMKSPSLPFLARPVNVNEYSFFTTRCVKICSLLKSAHTSPQSHQTRPCSGKSSASVQRRNDSRSTTQQGTLIFPSMTVTIMCGSLDMQTGCCHDNGGVGMNLDQVEPL